LNKNLFYWRPKVPVGKRGIPYIDTENKNGVIDKKEPLHIFWFSLLTPAKAKRLY